MLNLTLMLQTLHILLSSKPSSKSKILGNYQQISNKSMKNKHENKIKRNLSHEFIHYIADLIGLLDIFYF